MSCIRLGNLISVVMANTPPFTFPDGALLIVWAWLVVHMHVLWPGVMDDCRCLPIQQAHVLRMFNACRMHSLAVGNCLVKHAPSIHLMHAEGSWVIRRGHAWGHVC